MSAASPDTFVVDPLLSLSGDATAIANLAFGSLSRGADSIAGRHLALLTTESLELDLSDPAQRQFGDYELLELIGEGGMGVVYRARQPSLDREVAIKLLAAGPWASIEFVERFRREAQNAARMQHPNIVAIYEVGSAEELHFFSMRLIRGSSLAEVLKRGGKLSAQHAASLLRTIAEAVDYAHRLGVLHLDLKPANVLLDENGAPHVADFGLARRLEQGLAADNNEVSGTPSYMAPEQATAGARKITAATDIWGLGAVLYELVTGQPPFLGESAQATLKLVTESTLNSPRNLVAQLPQDLEAIILKCMERDVSARYPSARSLADDLGRFIENRPVHARPLSLPQRTWRWARRQPYLATLGMLFTVSMLAGIIGVTSQWKRAESNAIRAEANATQSSERLWESRRETAMRLQTDGKGFEALPALIANIEEQENAGKSNSSIERHEIGMILSQGLTLIDRMILADAHPLAAELSTDGSILAIALGDQTVRWFDTRTLSERGRVDLSGFPTSNGEENVARLLRFVDNRRLLVTLDWDDFLTNPTNRDTYLVDLNSAHVIQAPKEFADLTDAVYSADGKNAVLFNSSGGFQFWQVDPWRPMSALKSSTQRGGDSWLLCRGGNFALVSTGSNKVNLTLYDTRAPFAPKHIALPGFTEVTAWVESNSGSLVALGDSKGHVYLLDPKAASLRPLQTTFGSEVEWLAFSEDDQWLADVRRDGGAFAFDVTSGEPLNVSAMQQDFDTRQVAISHRERLLVASGFGDTALWRLSEAGATGGEATRVNSRPTRADRALTHSVGASLQSGLLVTTDMDGEVRLWRLQHSPAWAAGYSTAQIHTSENRYFDGAHLSDVAYNKVRVVSTRGGAPTPWVELPQPLAYAQTLGMGKSLLTLSGRFMYVFDAETMKSRYPAVQLQANPIRLVASADGALAIFAFGHNGKDGFEEWFEAYDLSTGQRRPGSAAVRGPLRQFELSPDASRLLATGSPNGATEVFDTATLTRLGSYPHDAQRPVVWASFTPGSDRLWLLARDIDQETADNADLIGWDPQSNRVPERRLIPGVYAVGLTAATGHPIVATGGQGLLDPQSTNPRNSARVANQESTSVFAVSHDGRLIAHVFGHDVQLYDADTLVAVGPPLHSNFGALNIPWSLSFSPDDKYLSAVGSQGQFLLWAVAADSRPLEEIRQDVELLSPTVIGQRILQMPSPEQSTRLRARDPGALPGKEERPALPAARMIANLPVPARDPAASAMMLDLTQAYTAAPLAQRGLLETVIPSVTNLPWGVAHLDGEDYDVRGIVELRQESENGRTAQDLQTHVSGILVPHVPIAAFHVLISAAETLPEPNERDYAQIRLHYLDGSSAVLPIKTQRDVPGYTENDQIVPVAFPYGDHTRFYGILKQTLFCDPRLINPHPARLIASLDLEAARENWSEPLFLAITAEPVIAATVSGSNVGKTGAE
jgi:serine/threonine protein kinase/WD40 repeat protein